jgi:hypothetical protein
MYPNSKIGEKSAEKLTKHEKGIVSSSIKTHNDIKTKPEEIY